MHFSGDAKYKLMLTSKLFQVEAKLVDDSYFFIGPALEERPVDESFDFKKDESKKLIYVSLGTVFNKKLIYTKYLLKPLETQKNIKELFVLEKKLMLKF